MTAIAQARTQIQQLPTAHLRETAVLTAVSAELDGLATALQAESAKFEGEQGAALDKLHARLQGIMDDVTAISGAVPSTSAEPGAEGRVGEGGEHVRTGTMPAFVQPTQTDALTNPENRGAPDNPNATV